MATQSGILAWEIPWTEGPGGLWSLGFQRVDVTQRLNHKWKWQPTPGFLSGESHGQRSLVGCCPLGHTESDTTEVTQHACMLWRRKWQLTPVFLPGESQGQRSLVGCHLWGRTESDTTEATQQQQQQYEQREMCRCETKFCGRISNTQLQYCLGFPGGSGCKESVCNAEDLNSIPVLGRSPGEGNSYPFQYSGLENSMDCTVHGVTKSWT